MTVSPSDEIELPSELMEEAAEWLLRLQEAPEDERLRTSLETWLGAAGMNSLAWQRTQKAWMAFGACEPHYRAHWEDASRWTVPPPRPAARRARWRSRGMLAAMAAAAICLTIFFAPMIAVYLRADYRTATAESRSITLQDGSTVLLSASSAIATDFSDGRRTVVLLEGEAFFDVVKDESRPFVVDANGVKVEVLGTAFDVEIGDRLTSVALARGVVTASLNGASRHPAETLAPGEMLVVDTSAGTMKKETVAIEDIAGWRTGRIYVVDKTIGSVIEQIRRYHPAWISVPDPGLARTTVTGFYDLGDPDQALEALVEPFGGKVRSVSRFARVVTRF